MTSGVVIQARMTSKRFPGKSMALLDGKPVLRHVIERAQKIDGVDKIVIAVPEDTASEPMIELCNFMDVATFAGDELDVLSRYWDAANAYGLDTIMRITADCPLIHPQLCSDVMKMHIDGGYDYTSNVFPVRSWPQGYACEVFTWDCLDAAQKIIQLFGSGDPDADYNREHVTPWMQKTDGIKRGLCKQKGVDKSDVNFCIDMPSDLQRIERIIKMSKLGFDIKGHRHAN